ncbi:3100_t:CDS:2, partial [Entrophospora sp. SA101]
IISLDEFSIFALNFSIKSTGRIPSNISTEISFSLNHSVLPVVLVCWYDYCSKKHPLKYGCPHEISKSL